MERLIDMPGRHLVLLCGPCGRRGVYRLDRLRTRFGAHACPYDVYVRLTQTCRYQHEVGARRPNQYGRACRAQIEVEEAARSGVLPSRR